nr:MAG TPA: hypothetical protein [Caudoviricetes sp.]
MADYSAPPLPRCSGCLRGRPPPDPRPGRAAFHASIVSGNQPRVAPIKASGSGR